MLAIQTEDLLILLESCLKKRKTQLFYDFAGSDLFTILFLGVLMDGTDFCPFCLCNVPLFLKNDNTAFFYDFVHDR